MVRKLKTGDRTRLVSMPMDPDPIPVGSHGTVLDVSHHGVRRDAWTQIEVSWENGRMLMLVSPPDKFEIIDGDK